MEGIAPIGLSAGGGGGGGGAYDCCGGGGGGGGAYSPKLVGGGGAGGGGGGGATGSDIPRGRPIPSPSPPGPPLRSWGFQTPVANGSIGGDDVVTGCAAGGAEACFMLKPQDSQKFAPSGLV